MAIIDNPTVSDICMEGLRLGGIVNPGIKELKRAENTWLPLILNEIWQYGEEENFDRRLKTLQTTAICIAVVGQRRYPLPSNFSEEFSVSILDWTDTGTVQTGAGSTVTLESDEDITEAVAVGKYYLGLTGTSKGQFRQITAYNTTTKVATVDVAWDSSKTPISGDTYAIIDEQKKLGEAHQSSTDEDLTPHDNEKPTKFSKYNDEFYFDNVPDQTYGIRLRYYANLSLIDWEEGSGTLMSKILRNWQHLLVRGIVKYTKEGNDDDGFNAAVQLFDRALKRLYLKEAPYGEDDSMRVSPEL
jgi:hypothetical protein